MSYFPNDELKQEILDGTVWTGGSTPASIYPTNSKYWVIYFGGTDLFSISVSVSCSVTTRLEIWTSASYSAIGTVEDTVNMNQQDYPVATPDFDFYYDPTSPVGSGRVLRIDSNINGIFPHDRAFSAENGIIMPNTYNGLVKITNNSNVTDVMSITWIGRKIT